MDKVNWYNLILENEKGKELIVPVLKSLEQFSKLWPNVLDKYPKAKKYTDTVLEALQWCDVAKGCSEERIVDELYLYDFQNCAIGSSHIYRHYLHKTYSKTTETFIRMSSVVTDYIIGISGNCELFELRDFIMNVEIRDFMENKDVMPMLIEALKTFYYCYAYGHYSEDKYADLVKRIDEVLDIVVNPHEPIPCCAFQRIKTCVSRNFDIKELPSSIEFMLAQYNLWNTKEIGEYLAYDEIIWLLDECLNLACRCKIRSNNKITGISFHKLREHLMFKNNTSKELLPSKAALYIFHRYVAHKGNEHAKLEIKKVDSAIVPSIQFSIPCKALIDFCNTSMEIGYIDENTMCDIIDSFMRGDPQININSLVIATRGRSDKK